jgi:senataxin
MVEVLAVSPTGMEPYGGEEVDRAIGRVVVNCALNPSQLLALNKAISQTISLIQGPPGTGKTRTACAILAALVALKTQRLQEGGDRAKGQRLLKVLACAHSNTAADNLLEGFVLGLGLVLVLGLGLFTNLSKGFYTI